MTFLEKLASARRRNTSRLCVSLDIVVAHSPLSIQYYDEPMLPFAREIIDATRDLVCAYAVNPGYYLAEGAAGMVALERIVRLVPDGVPLIFDGRFVDEGALPSYLRGAFEQYRADAVTLGFGARIAPFAQADPRRVLIHRLGAVPVPPVAPSCVWLESSDEAALSGVEAVNPACVTVMDAGRDGFPSHRARQTTLDAVYVVGKPILYATRRVTFADDARVAAASFRDRFGA